MKKILFIHHGLSSVGAGLCALHIIDNLPKNEYEVVVCLPCGNGDLLEKIKESGVKVRQDFDETLSYMHISGVNWPFFSIFHIRNIINVEKNKKIIMQILKEEKPDIVMVNSLTLFWIGNICRKKDIKAICFDRETYCKGLFGVRTNLIKRSLNRNFDKIVFISYFDMRETGNKYEKYCRITDKVDAKLYSNLNKDECLEKLKLPRNNSYVLYNGGPSKLKGINTVLKTLPLLDSHVKIVALQFHEPEKCSSIKKFIQRKIGLDENYNAIEYIKKRKLENKIILRGQTDRVELYFGACDVVIFPSVSPHQARPIYEAGFAKKPIIVSDFPNTREFLTNENGYLVKSDDYVQWAEKINAVVGGNNSKVITQNLEFVEQTNNLNKLTEELQKLMKSIECE